MNAGQIPLSMAQRSPAAPSKRKIPLCLSVLHAGPNERWIPLYASAFSRRARMSTRSLSMAQRSRAAPSERKISP